jgi:poly-gamma-glutamate synthesis protein (capsule biosynthesis protein)
MNKRERVSIIILILLSLVLSSCRAVTKPDIHSENINIYSEDEVIPIEEKVEDKVEEITLLAVGDIMFHSPQVRAAYLGEGNYDFTPTFKYVKEYIESVDLALANYETVTLDNKPYSGFPRFNSPKETILALADTGFDIISTANNHSLDGGKSGVLSTLNAIEEYELKSIGTYKNSEEQILIEDIKGIKIGFLSYTYGLNGLDSLLTKDELSYMINLINEDKIKADIEKTKELGVDLTVLFLHWGNEYHNDPSNYQMELGEKIIEWGGNIIFGSHPHVIQKSETLNNPNNYIIYSMGNFLSNQSNDTMGNSLTEDGVMVKLNIEKNFTTGESIIKEVEYIPTWVYKYKSEGKFNYEILPIEEVISKELEIELTKTVFNRIEDSFNNTLDTLMGN